MSFLNMKASVMAGLKWDPEILALKIRRIKKPQRRPQRSAAKKHAHQRPVRSIVPSISKRRIKSDSLKVSMKLCE